MAPQIILYRSTGMVLARASTDPGGLELPGNLDLNDDAAAGPGRAWLARLWRRDDVQAALRAASPALSRQIDVVLGGGCVDARQMRRVLVSVSSFLLRWQRRPTPFGLFAGVGTVSVGDQLTAGFGHAASCATGSFIAPSNWPAGSMPTSLTADEFRSVRPRAITPV